MNKTGGRYVIDAGNTKVEHLSGASSAIEWNDLKEFLEHE